MAKCEMCGKGPQFGHNVSHSKRATNRQFKPNIQRVRAVVDGRVQRIKVSTKAIRMGLVVKPLKRNYKPQAEESASE